MLFYSGRLERGWRQEAGLREIQVELQVVKTKHQTFDIYEDIILK